MSLQLGEILADKYRIVRLLGQGGMGEVYEGENLRIRRRVAIKTLLAAVSSKPDVVQRFEREAQAAGRIGSEHIVEVLDLGDLPDGSRFMVMEFLEGTTLQDRIVSKGRIPSREAARVVAELLDGLGAAHQAGIIHRDLKPANIFLLTTKQGRADFVKILDFGVSKFSVLSDEMSMTSTGAVVGTPYYMSPEQAKGAKFIDARSDLYSVGVILYETITGQVPFNAQTFNELIFKIALETPPPPESFVPDLDPRMAAIIRRSMARESAERFQTALEFKETLETWAAEFDRGTPMTSGGTVVGWTPAPGARPASQPPVGRMGGTQMMPATQGRPPAAVPPMPTVFAQPPSPGGAPAIAAAPPAKKSSMLPVFLVLAALGLGGAITAAIVLKSKNAEASDSNGSNATSKSTSASNDGPSTPPPKPTETSSTPTTPASTNSALVLGGTSEPDSNASGAPTARTNTPPPPPTQVAVAHQPPPPPPAHPDPITHAPPPPPPAIPPPPTVKSGRAISGTLD